MTLRRKVLTAIIITLVALTVLLYGLARVSILRSFTQVEEYLAHQNIERIVGAIDSEVEALNGLAYDYAYWKATYDYVESRDPSYIIDNYSLEGTTVVVDLVMIIGSDGERIFEQTMDHLNPNDYTERSVVQGDPSIYELLQRLAPEYSGKAGIITTNDKLWIAAFQPIFNGLEIDKPSRGYLVLANPLDEEAVSQIRQLTKLEVDLWPIALLSDAQTGQAATTNSTPTANITTTAVHIHYTDDNEISVGTDYVGLTGKPVFHLHINSERPIYKQGISSLWYVIVGALAVGLVTSLLGYATFELLVMQPVLRLDQRVRTIAKSGQLSGRVAVDGVGEFATLANNINDMIAGLEQAQRSLLESEERFRMMVESAPDAVVVMDANSGHCVEVNDKALHFFGYTSRAEFYKRAVYDFIRPPAVTTPVNDTYVKRQAERALSGLAIAFETSILRLDQSEIPCEVRFTSFPGQERPLLRATITDISERKQAEARALQAQKLESLGLLAGGVAHDFNNLLTGMLGQTSLALRKLPADHVARSHILKAISSAERAAIMTRQLLAYAGRGIVHFELLDLNRLVQETATLLETALAKHVHLDLELNSNLPWIEADLGQMQQVVMNLVINAAEAIPTERTGKIKITLATESIAEDVETQYVGGQRLLAGDYVCLQVSDNGAGIEPLILQRIFDPFFTTKETGNGLGLAATLGVVRRHYGAIQVISRVSEGTTFRLFFPAKNKPIIDSATVVLPGDKEVNGVVLVIDDELPVRQTVRDILEASGIFVIDAENGRIGIDQYKRHFDEINVVIIDMQMPLLNGIETLQALRVIEPNVKVIMSSGYSENESARTLFNNEQTLFLPKPYDSESLLGKVYQLIKI